MFFGDISRTNWPISTRLCFGRVLIKADLLKHFFLKTSKWFLRYGGFVGQNWVEFWVENVYISMLVCTNSKFDICTCNQP